MAGANYFRGFLLEANTNNATKQFHIRDSDTNALHSFTGGPSANNINHPAQSQIEYAFDTPFVAHLCRYEPGNDGVQIQVFGIEWKSEPWPELTTEASPFLDAGTSGAKYLRGAIIPMDTNGNNASVELDSLDGGSVTIAANTTAAVKTPVPVAFSVPLIAHELQFRPQNAVRIWYPEIQWIYDPWPELISEATGWIDILPGGAAAFLQGLLLSVEAAGADIQLSLLTDVSPTPIPLTAIRTPLANVKTPIPYSLATPVVCHQAQIIPSAPCRLWISTIRWFAEATPELAHTWTTQPTSHGASGYHSILRMEPAYSAIADVTLSITSFDGTSPVTLTLPSTGGAKRKMQVNPTFNKGQLYTYSAVSSAAFQIYEKEFLVWIGQWGRSGLARPYTLLGGAFDDKAGI